MKLVVLMAMGAVLVCPPAASGAQEGARAKRRAVPVAQVRIEDEFWGPRLETNRKVTLPHNLKQCEETGRISNFARAAKLEEGKYEGRFYNDSDVYKVLEGAAYVLAMHPDEQLEARIDAIIDKIAAAQQPDGYINTYYTLNKPDKRWTNLEDMHELYCAGHMFEAAVAYARATGKTKLLDVSRKMADHIDGIFGPGKRIGTSGHEEIELALVKLYRETGEERYRKLAEFFIDVRGKDAPAEGKERERAEYRQAHMPVRDQREIVGHAVRAMYLYCGVADVAALTGDAGYVEAMNHIWNDVAHRKMYITGAVGARHQGEAFGGAYELPNDTAYAETCAGIGLALWSHRLGLLYGDAQFADVLERVLYNHLLASVSLKGDTFFYVNPMASDGKRKRDPWFGTACCPTNVVRVIPQVGRFAYTQTDDAVWVNLYVAGTARITLAGNEVKLTQETRYPWSREVKITVQPAGPTEFAVHLRIPGWCRGAGVRVNRKFLPGVTPQQGYVTIRRTWERGDAIELDLPMPIRRIQAHPNVAANRGCVALQRGPIVYCLEAVDNDGKVFNLALPRDAKLTASFEPDLLGGVMVITGKGLAAETRDWKDTLYQPVPATREAEITAVPYCLWNNRDPGEMTVWIPEVAGLNE